MSAVPRAAFRCLRRGLRAAEREGVPVTGIVPLSRLPDVISTAQLLRHEFKHAQDERQLDEAFLAIRALEQQTGALKKCEEETRQALRAWAELQARWALRGAAHGWDAATRGAAVEDAAWLAHHLHVEAAAASMLIDEEADDARAACARAEAAAREQLDELAAAARAAAPDAFAGCGGSSGSSSSSAAAPPQPAVRAEQLGAVITVLFKGAGRFKADPLEWVYDGLAPALLPPALESRKGTPLTLALAGAGVARRAGVPAEAVCAHDQAALSTNEGRHGLHDLPPEVAARQAGRTVAAPPAPSTWLVRVAGSTGSAGDDDEAAALYVDVARRRGAELLDAAAAAARYPSLARGVSVSAGGVTSASFGAPVAAAWADIARTLVVAHQRRGESDLVAHWMYVAMALDSAAPEWAHVLR